MPRIYRAGRRRRRRTPAGRRASSTQWREMQAVRDPRFYGFGWGADMNGFGAQGGPRNGPNPVTYPFKSFDGTVRSTGSAAASASTTSTTTASRTTACTPTGSRTCASWPARRSSTTWRAAPRPTCRCGSAPRASRPAAARRAALRRRGLAGARLGAEPERCCGAPASRRARRAAVELLRRRAAGDRGAHAARARRARRSTAPGPQGARDPHRDEGEARQGRSKAFGRGVRIKRAGRAFVYGVRGGRVRYVAVASRSRGREPRGAAAVSAARSVCGSAGERQRRLGREWVQRGGRCRSAGRPCCGLHEHTPLSTPPRHVEPTPTQPPLTFAGRYRKLLPSPRYVVSGIDHALRPRSATAR